LVPGLNKVDKLAPGLNKVEILAPGLKGAENIGSWYKSIRIFIGFGFNRSRIYWFKV